MTRYASETGVPIERSRAEIERILTRYGAHAFMYAVDANKAMIAFEVTGRHIRMVLPMPTDKDDKIGLDRWGYKRSDSAVQVLIEKEARRRWRALALVIKAKLEAVSSGIAVFDDEFLAYTVLPSGETFGQWAKPQLNQLASGGRMPKMLSAGTE